MDIRVAEDASIAARAATTSFRLSFFETWRDDVPAGIVVFLVGLPLCLGIAVTSGVPLLSGVIAGVVGGLVVGALSGSSVMVTGPAAGLAPIVALGIQQLGSFERLLPAVALGGMMQIVLSAIRAGTVSYYVPSSVIKGMLAGIGITLILKQIPHAVGYDSDAEGDMAFIEASGQTTISNRRGLAADSACSGRRCPARGRDHVVVAEIAVRAPALASSTDGCCRCGRRTQ